MSDDQSAFDNTDTVSRVVLPDNTVFNSSLPQRSLLEPPIQELPHCLYGGGIDQGVD